MVRLEVKQQCSFQLVHLCFNSSMVRLEDKINPLSIAPGPGFNSSMVRLEAECRKHLKRFQRSFNSSMVRLEDTNFTSSSPFNWRFNSSMVRLEENRDCNHAWEGFSFNSSMVRLEVLKIYRRHCVISVSIPVWFDWKKTHPACLADCSRVSIPVWFDWKVLVSQCQQMAMVVSIPVWFDWKLCSIQSCGSWEKVSIPVWFDWKANSSVNGTTFAFGFNSSMVRLEAKSSMLPVTKNSVSIPVWFDWKRKLPPWPASLNMFQFQYGSIGRCCCAPASRAKKCFNSSMVRLEENMPLPLPSLRHVSIPVWFDWKRFFLCAWSRDCWVSIPVWFDWKLNAESTWNDFNVVSIPVWFDWKLNLSCCSIWFIVRFNSSMVRLEDDTKYKTLYKDYVSIPVWFDWKSE